VDGTAPLSDVVDGDVISYASGSATLTAGDEYAANASVTVPANSVWAMLFEVRVE
jgi:hypothetical protein